MHRSLNHPTRAVLLVLLSTALLLSAHPALAATARELVQAQIQKEYASLEALYKDLHAHPELSFQEEKTARKVADELKQAGFVVTTKVGGNGVVGVLRNGNGPTILVRTDLDALPVKEETGLPYASTDRAKDDKGNEVSVMHACGHDMHMTVFIGTARTLAALKDRWQGTLVLIGQPAEERVGGARQMIADGLFTRFPRPDYCLALHVNGSLPTGSVGHTEGFALANVDTVDITFRGVGGHGSAPHATKDPIVLAAQAIMAFQTIVSRETEPGNPAVVTVGSIHGGTKHNIIPDEVKLQLTVRSYTDEVRTNSVASIKRITRAMAQAAGVPDNRMPVVTLSDESVSATYNDPPLTRRLSGAFQTWLGADKTVAVKPIMGAEDFSEYGRTTEKIPICMFWLGAVEPKRVEESRRSGTPLPSLHSSRFAPVPEPTIRTGVAAMTAAVLELMGKK